MWDVTFDKKNKIIIKGHINSHIKYDMYVIYILTCEAKNLYIFLRTLVERINVKSDTVNVYIEKCIELYFK